MRIFLFFLIVSLSGISSGQSLTEQEQQLYDLVMAYRKKAGLPAIPVSKSLTKVAHMHANDLVKNNPVHGECNLHSWSDQGDWTPCCYTSDHAQARAMWDKPRELTSYTGNGYEISHQHSAMATPEGALKSWQNSSAHDDVIMNRGIWKKHKWQAIGIAIKGNYAMIWFGDLADE